MVSALGGTLGLFTGFSILTFVDICFWCYAIFKSVCWGKTRAKRGLKRAMIKTKDRIIASIIIQALEINQREIYNTGWRPNQTLKIAQQAYVAFYEPWISAI